MSASSPRFAPRSVRSLSHWGDLESSDDESLGGNGLNGDALTGAAGDGQGHSTGPDRTAFVHDWLPVYAGAERVLEQMISTVSDADVFSLIDYVPDDQRAFLQGRPVQTSFLQRMPFSKSHYRYYLPLAPIAIEQFDLRDYDLVVSSSYAVAKGALTRPDQLHISYVHSPIRYAWDLYHDHLEGMGGRLRRTLARLVLHYMRLYDTVSADRVDLFLANSNHVAQRIWKTYRRRAEVLYPPVDVDRFTMQPVKDDYYLTMSRLVPYKRVDLIVEAFASMPDKELVVIGDGPDLKRLERLATRNVTLLGYQPDDAVEYYMQNARAFVFAAEEDFGITPVEAQACGTPVIAYGRGGALETVVDGETGLFFPRQTPDHVCEAVGRFEAGEPMDPERIRKNAERFSIRHFRAAFARRIRSAYAGFVGAPRTHVGAVRASG